MNQLTSLYSPEIVSQAKAAMKEDCFFLIPNLYSKAFCDEIKADIDSISSGSGVEVNYGGTETRIWSAQKRFSGVKRFFDDSNELASSVFEKKMIAGTVLAIKNKPLTELNQTHHVGRWHADSFKSQEKVFLFLTDTNEDSGPLEFIPNTHKTLFRYTKALEPGFFFNYLNFPIKKKGLRQYQSIPDKKIQSLFDRGYKTKPLLVSAGSVLLIDTAKLIHRARPCKEGMRYALTAYYSTGKGYRDYQVS